MLRMSEGAHPRFPGPTAKADGFSVDGLRSGAADAMTACYLAHAPRLLQLAIRLTGERAEAEDAVHDVFVGLPEALRRYEERGQFGAWLRRLTVTQVLMRRRKERARGEVVHVDSAIGGNVVDPSVNAELTAEMIGVERALLSLSPPLREVFVLRVVEGYTHAEIAALLGITVGTSEVRLTRAVHAMRERMGGKR